MAIKSPPPPPAFAKATAGKPHLPAVALCFMRRLRAVVARVYEGVQRRRAFQSIRICASRGFLLSQRGLISCDCLYRFPLDFTYHGCPLNLSHRAWEVLIAANVRGITAGSGPGRFCQEYRDGWRKIPLRSPRSSVAARSGY